MPPYPIPKVPDIESVPDDVIGPPVNEKPVNPPDTPTLVTVPVVGVVQSIAVPFDDRTCPLVPTDVRPVPPLAAPRVPASVIVPDDVIGPPLKVRPVKPPETLTLDTVAVGVPQTIEEPFDVRTCPLEPTVVRPVPPLAVFNVPLSVRVPEPVIGLPENVRPVVPPEAETLVTVPVPEGVAHITPVPVDVRT